MPAPDRVLATLRRAFDAVRATPGRRGHRLDLQDCTEVLVAGDLHGHVPNFQQILTAADLANRPTRHLILQEVVHGKFRYPDGSDKSHQLVDLFAALKCQYPARVHLIPGNHEMAQWTGRKVMKADEDLNTLFHRGVLTAYGTGPGAEIYKTYVTLFKALPVVIRTPNAVCVSHSLPPGRALPLFDVAKLEKEQYDDADLQPGGTIHSLLWGRDTDPRTVGDYLRKVDCDLLVSGHIPSETGYDAPNDRQLIVDCCGTPAAYVLFPADRPLTHAELVGCVRTI